MTHKVTEAGLIAKMETAASSQQGYAPDLLMVAADLKIWTSNSYSSQLKQDKQLRHEKAVGMQASGAYPATAAQLEGRRR